MKSRSRHKPTQNSSALQCRLHKQEARCQKTHSCSPSSVWASSHLECIVAAGMAGETTYNQMMLWRRLSSLFTRADLPSSVLASPPPPAGSCPFFFHTGVYTADLFSAPFLCERCDDGDNKWAWSCMSAALAMWKWGNGFHRDEFSEKSSPTHAVQ